MLSIRSYCNFGRELLQRQRPQLHYDTCRRCYPLESDWSATVLNVASTPTANCKCVWNGFWLGWARTFWYVPDAWYYSGSSLHL